MIVRLPLEIKGLLTYLVTQGIKAFLGLFGKDMSGWTSAVAASLSAAIIFFIEDILAVLPEEAVPGVNSGLAFAVALLSAFGLHYTYKNVKNPT